MTNNPTIDGVPGLRALLERLAYPKDCDDGYFDDVELLRALLEVPVVECQPVALSIPEECPHLIVFDDNDRESMLFAGAGSRSAALKTWEKISMSWNAHLFVRIERNSRDDRYPSAEAYTAPPEVAALQSTIAQLQARIAELESARGEPVMKLEAERLLQGDGEYAFSFVKAGWLEECRKTGGEFLLFTAPPAPVSDKYDEVLLPFLSLMRAELHANAHKGDRPGWLQMDRNTAVLEVFYHLGKLHQAVHRDESAAIKEHAADVANMCMMLLDVCACLDATAALNNKPSTEVKP
ncbi:hypothetical protein [Pseudomonas koreensis]|uniref:hypothetical protein n=1 Tax=Pseudomonas koreensis TaxID=198620 RepID=UPI0020774B54|nr:hypothetical protein [Pseudomonas koreensis]MCM8743582.1 hypothetical protein [Pseudomonas koreensis]